ncbi:PAS domain S-box protein [Methanocella arvoryzae]|uniref:Predicted signal transduction protein n=1 Tax=Methanocella arvoryzae (strain DSM 22066 / NBRC 105507 / MRE50) TaxID=351160 RepID=Q0W7V1_METAR|nr:PAS domain S-box protein [Methanocella arvoryzae]CAJ35542.1 predicted signal transduction protein [Methanocella arvoryzae MRE50]
MLAERSRPSSHRETFSQLVACERLGVAAIAVDVSFRIVFFNEKARKISGYSRENALRKSIFDIVVSGDLKKCLRRSIRGDAIEPCFTTRCNLVTRDGKIRSVEWQGTTMYGEGKAVGVLLTCIDVTESELVREAARIAARARDIDEMATSFMDLLGDPLNLKIARLSIYADGRAPLTLTRVFPHGGVRKKPRHALDDCPADREMDMKFFRLQPGDRCIGALEVTAYAGCRLTEEDAGCIQALCDIISSGITRLIPPDRRLPDLSGIRESGSAVAIVHPGDYRVIDASSSFAAITGKADLACARLTDLIPSAGLVEALRSAVATGTPSWGTCPESGRIFCCVPVSGESKESDAIIVSLLNATSGSLEPGNSASALQGAHAADILSMLPHGLALCDANGLIVTVNNTLSGLLGLDRQMLEGRLLADVLRTLNPRHVNGMPLKRKLFSLNRLQKPGSEAEAFVTIDVSGRRRTINALAAPIFDDKGSKTGFIITVRDATVLHALLRMSRATMDSEHTGDLIDESMDIILNAARLKLAWLYLYDGTELALEVQKGDVSGAPLPVCREVPEADSPTLQCRAFNKAGPVLIKDYRRCASVRTFDPLAKSRSIRSMAAVPLIADGSTIGVLVAATGPGQPLREQQLSELAVMCDQLSIGIARSQHRQVRRAA